MSLGLSVPLAADAGPLANVHTSAEIFDGATGDPYTLALRAYVWGYPLVRAAQLRHNITRPDDPFVKRPAAVAGAPLNTMGHARVLAGPETRIGVAPNNDTLYSLAWLDLSGEPFVLETPDFGARYYTFQMGQADTSTAQSLGQRTHGGTLPPVFIHGPGFRGATPAGMIGVRSKHRYLLVAGRILVDGPSDLAAVHALQDRIRLRPWSAYADGRPAPDIVPAQRPLPHPAGIADDLVFLRVLGTVLRDWDPEPQDRALIDSLGAIGLTREHGFHARDLAAAQRAAIVEGLTDGAAIVRAKAYELGRKVNGWSINYSGASFGSDYLLRAAVAMDQIYIVEPEEALYPSGRVDSAGQQLDGRYRYRIRFTRENLPPVDAFWSITLYYAKGFMVPNAIDRWAIGDRTPGLVYGPDGSLEILIQHERPADAANWLPAPQEPFMLLMRLYNPREPILEGRWLPPTIERVIEPMQTGDATDGPD